MGKVWTAGMAWALLAWLPFYLNWPLALQVTLGLPVFLSGYVMVLVEGVFGAIPNGLSMCISLGVGVVLSAGIKSAYLLTKGKKGKKLEKEVG